MAQLRVRPSKPMSAVSAAIGFFMIVFGIGFTHEMWATPGNPPWMVKIFPIVWTAIAASFCVYHLANLFRRSGAAHEVVDTNDSISPLGRTEARLAELSTLREKKMITEEEFQQRRSAILDEV